MRDDEAQNLRRYLLKGGLILFDDFETTQWNNMAAQMRRVLPELQWIEIDVTHPVFHSFFELKRDQLRPSDVSRHGARLSGAL